MTLGIFAATVQRNVKGCWSLGLPCCVTASPGGQICPRGDGSPLLDSHDRFRDGVSASGRAGHGRGPVRGGRWVVPVHEHAHGYRSWADATAAIGALPMKPHLTRVVSAHAMGGCALGGEERIGVARSDGLRWPLENLSVHDGSLFPTSIGANPQLSIYGIVNRLANALAQRLSGRAVQLA